MRHSEIEELLLAELEVAKSWYEAARAEFTIVCNDIPSGLPQPDGTQRIKNAGRNQRASREAFQTALDRFNNFVLRHEIPDDLKIRVLNTPTKD